MCQLDDILSFFHTKREHVLYEIHTKTVLAGLLLAVAAAVSFKCTRLIRIYILNKLIPIYSIAI